MCVEFRTGTYFNTGEEGVAQTVAAWLAGVSLACTRKERRMEWNGTEWMGWTRWMGWDVIEVTLASPWQQQRTGTKNECKRSRFFVHQQQLNKYDDNDGLNGWELGETSSCSCLLIRRSFY